MMEAPRTSETSVDSYFTRQYIPEDNSELHTLRRKDLKSHIKIRDDGGSTYLWNICRQLFYTAVHPRRQFWTSYSPPWEPEISQSALIVAEHERNAGPIGRALWGAGVNRLDSETVGLNPAQSADVYPRLLFILFHLSPYYRRYII
jgi:hypothetical protein